MKKLSYILIPAFLLSGLTTMSQNDVDALRYSRVTFGGTARYMGMGGAFGALGGDMSVLATNPAGIGIYKTSEFTFSPSLYVGKTTADYNGKTSEDQKYNFNVSNVGMVLTITPGERVRNSGWKNFQFGFAINRNGNFNNRSLIEGNNMASSMLDAYVGYANNNVPDDLNEFDTRLAFDTWLLDTLPGGRNYVSAAPHGGVLQKKSVTSSGSMNEFDLSFGGNFNEKLYLGATLGFPYLKYEEQSTYKELALADSLGFTEFRNFTRSENLTTHGSGFNFKFGLIYRVNDWVRLGAAVHTPTFFDMKDDYSTEMKSLFDNGDNYSASSPEGKYNYSLETPMRVTGSLAFIIAKAGLISADYEFLDYSQARLRSDDYDYSDVNDVIRQSYTTQSNLRLGTEWKLEPFSIRGGYALYGSPFKSGLNDAEARSISVGFGVREDNYFLDFAFINTKYKEKYYLYDKNLVNPSGNDITQNNFVMTLGLKF